MALDFSGDGAAVQSDPLFSTTVEKSAVESQSSPLQTSEISTLSNPKCPPPPAIKTGILFASQYSVSHCYN